MVDRKSKKPKYFKYNDGSSKASSNLSVLVRWIEDDSEQVMSDGPYKISEAENRCQGLLRDGICAWLVKYNNE